jgi:hypothetical protein
MLLLAGLIATALAARYMKSVVDAAAARDFDFVCNEIRLNIEARLVVCAQILHSGVGMHASP